VKPFFLAVACVVGLVQNSFAHYLWIEADGKPDAKIYFGEIQEGVREKSGGKLDGILGVEAFVQKQGAPKPKSVSSEKMEDHFLARTGSTAEYVLFASRDTEVKDYTKSGIGIIKPMFYSRSGPMNSEAPPQPSLELDILPVAGSPGSFQVYFKKNPLADAKVMIYAPNLWMQEFKSDAEGKIKIETPWEGRYVLDAVHKEELKGVFKGKSYDAIRHRATYVFIR
jgi:hypothetical protein